LSIKNFIFFIYRTVFVCFAFHNKCAQANFANPQTGNFNLRIPVSAGTGFAPAKAGYRVYEFTLSYDRNDFHNKLN